VSASEATMSNVPPALAMQRDNQRDRARDFARMEQALEWLSAHALERPSLDQAARAMAMSPFHFQRMFSHWAGVSPKQFLQALSLACAKRRLAAGASVLEAALEAGFSGPGRLHETLVNVEAATPGEFKRGLAGVRIAYGFHPSPFGECLVMTTPRGVCALGFVRAGQRDATREDLARRFPGASFARDDDNTAATVTAIFAAPGKPPCSPLRLLLCGTRFQLQVWRALLELPPGSHASYGDLATRIGNSRASRAVGSAVGANPIAYVIPCHRVIRRTGVLGGYHWGAGRKLAILGMEAVAHPL